MLVALAACSSYDIIPPPRDTYTPIAAASAPLLDASGVNVGTAMLTTSGDDVRLSVTATRLPAGAHGLHIHQVGTCTPPDFASAGPHWNPTGHQHGKDNPAGMHRGDLPNLLVGANGQGSIEYVLPSASIGGGNAILDSDGAALVVHATADDYRTDPSGNSGARIACGVFQPS